MFDSHEFSKIWLFPEKKSFILLYCHVECEKYLLYYLNLNVIKYTLSNIWDVLLGR